MKPYAFGVDIGGTAIKLGLFQTGRTLLEKWQIPTRTEKNGQNVLSDALLTLQQPINAQPVNISEFKIRLPGK